MVLRKDACSRVRAPVLMAALVAALLCLPAIAQADPVTFNTPPTLTGNPVEGSTLQVGVDASPPIPPTTAAYQWQRCKPLPAGCGVIGGASGSSYTLTPDDVGWQIVAYVTLTNGPDTAGPTPTPASDIVRAKPAPPPPPPPPPTPTPIPPTVSTAASLPAGPAFLRPFPIVRIRGFFAKGGARITLLSVKGPKVARVHARCIGRGCPVRTLTMFPADGRLHRFERFLRAGIKLQIRVTRPGRIGSYTSFLIRSRKAPVRTDRCLSVKTGKPILCSAP